MSKAKPINTDDSSTPYTTPPAYFNKLLYANGI